MDIENLIEFTQALVQIQSFSGAEEKAAQRVSAEMQALGFDQIYADDNGSVVGIIQGAQPGKTLLFDGHTDTVGIAPGVPWQSDPFGAHIAENAIHGRGSADMKGALAAMIYAAAAVERTRLSGRVVVSASVLEEVLEGVALQAIIERERPDCVVIGEPSDLNLTRAGRGRAELHLTTVGRPAHSSSPQFGRNAVLDMLKVIAALEAQPVAEDPLLGPAIMALTDIISEPFPGHSVIPSLCKATYDRRLLPGDTPEAVVAAVTNLPGLGDIDLRVQIGQGEYAAYTGAMLRAEKFFPAWAFPEEHWFVQQAMQGLHSVGLTPNFNAYRFCTNAAYSAGVAGVPTVGFGPAQEGDAHVINERLRLPDLIATARGYAGIIAAVLT